MLLFVCYRSQRVRCGAPKGVGDRYFHIVHVRLGAPGRFYVQAGLPTKSTVLMCCGYHPAVPLSWMGV